jgi:hypothetical protein
VENEAINVAKARELQDIRCKRLMLLKQQVLDFADDIDSEILKMRSDIISDGPRNWRTEDTIKRSKQLRTVACCAV